MYVDTPVTGWADVLVAVKKARAAWPGITRMERWAGANRQGRPAAVSALKVTVNSEMVSLCIKQSTQLNQMVD